MSEIIKTASESLVKRAQGLDRLKEYWEGLPDITRSTLVNSALGGAVGGALGGTVGSATGEGGGKAALIAAMLGGTAAGAGTLGWKMLRGGMQMPGEQPIPGAFADRVMDSAVGQVASHPGLAAGAGAGGLALYLRSPTRGRVRSTLTDIGSSLKMDPAALPSLYDALGEKTFIRPKETAVSGPTAPGAASTERYVADAERFHGDSWPKGLRNIADRLRRKIPIIGRMPAWVADTMAASIARQRLMHTVGGYGRGPLGSGISHPAAAAGIAGGSLLAGYLVDRYMKGQNR